MEKEFCFAKEQIFFKGIQDDLKSINTLKVFFPLSRMRNPAGIPKFFRQQRAYSQKNANNNIFF